MVAIYKRAGVCHKLKGVLHSADVTYLASLNRQAKIKRIQTTAMPYRMKLAAICAVSQASATVKHYR